MFQSVLTSKNISVKNLEKDYNTELNSIANKIVNKYKFGVEGKFNYIDAIRIKNLLSLINNMNDINYLKHYFNTIDVKEVVNKLNSILKS